MYRNHSFCFTTRTQYKTRAYFLCPLKLVALAVNGWIALRFNVTRGCDSDRGELLDAVLEHASNSFYFLVRQKSCCLRLDFRIFPQDLNCLLFVCLYFCPRWRQDKSDPYFKAKLHENKSLNHLHKMLSFNDCLISEWESSRNFMSHQAGEPVTSSDFVSWATVVSVPCPKPGVTA